MKRVKVLAIVVAAISVMLAGCEEVNKGDTETVMTGDKVLETVSDTSGVSFFEIRDKETGVHYFVSKPGGISVRVNADGTPYVD